MGGGITLPNININPGSAGGGMPASTPFADAGQAFLQALLSTRAEKQADSRSSAAMELQKQEFALQKAAFDIKKAEIEHQHTLDEQKGAATQLFLEHALPQMAATGQLNGMMGAGDQGAGMASGQAIQQGVQQGVQQGPHAPQGDRYRQFLGGMDPEALIGFVKDILPVLQSQQRQDQRDAIMKKYPERPNETTPQTLDRFRKLSAAYATAGDHSMVASIAEAAGALKPPAEQYEWFQTKEGKTVFLPKEEGSRLRLTKPMGSSQSGFGFGPGGPMGVIRAISAIDGMKDADTKMRAYEIKLASGAVNLNDKDYFQGHLTQLYNEAAKESGIVGHIVPFFSTAAGTQMMERLNKSNPEYAQYLQAAAQWALEESLLSNRPSDFRVKMDEFISAVKIGAGKGSIHDLWKSRGVRLGALERGKPTLQRILDRAASMPNMPGTTIIPDPESP